jgi:hypothetical protein
MPKSVYAPSGVYRDPGQQRQSITHYLALKQRPGAGPRL